MGITTLQLEPGSSSPPGLTETNPKTTGLDTHQLLGGLGGTFVGELVFGGRVKFFWYNFPPKKAGKNQPFR